MESVEARFRRHRRNAGLGAASAVAFAMIAVPLVLADGFREGRLVSLAPAVAVATVCLWVAVKSLRHARFWRQLPPGGGALREGLADQKSLDARGVLGGLVAFFIVWMPLKMHADWSLYAAEPHRAIVGVGCFFMMVGVLRWGFTRAVRAIDVQLNAIGSTGAGG